MSPAPPRLTQKRYVSLYFYGNIIAQLGSNYKGTDMLNNFRGIKLHTKWKRVTLKPSLDYLRSNARQNLAPLK